ncbi:GTP-binding protein, partial [Escherichia coli]|uniref:GTP-binding protein n=1 Tax=Escherichia coli TaxID=562 RepID=UPI0023AF6694
PGHQDFSEDTYRTLMAADSAVMVIDAAKGIEAQTRKLFKVCAMRHIPIFTIINKLDREARDPFELLDELEKEFGIGTYPVNWPIGCGVDFKGVFDRDKREILTFKEFHRGQDKLSAVKCDITDTEKLDELIGEYQRAELV